MKGRVPLLHVLLSPHMPSRACPSQIRAVDSLLIGVDHQKIAQKHVVTKETHFLYRNSDSR